MIVNDLTFILPGITSTTDRPLVFSIDTNEGLFYVDITTTPKVVDLYQGIPENDKSNLISGYKKFLILTQILIHFSTNSYNNHSSVTNIILESEIFNELNPLIPEELESEVLL